jgi:hypothetical protein
MIGGTEAALAPAAGAVRVHHERRRVTRAESAWIAAGPCALGTLVAIVLLGPPLGHMLFRPGAVVFFPEFEATPRPVQHARYLVALAGPLLLAAAVATLAVRGLLLRASTIRGIVWASQLALVLALGTCLAAENDVLLHAYPPPQLPNPLFNLQTLLTAAAVPALLLLALRHRRLAELAAVAARERTGLRTACAAFAAAYAALWLVTGIDSDSTIGESFGQGWIQWPVNETFAVFNGRTPLVDFHAQYGHLAGYLPALTMSLFGTTLLVWTLTMAAISWGALLGIYATFRLIARSSLLALALFVPFVAVTYFVGAGTRMHRLSPSNIFSLWPIRYAGPYLVAWLVARHLNRLRPLRPWLLFLVAGVAALNNPEFGFGAVAGTLLALACQHAYHTRRGALRLLANAAGGLLGALALLSLLTIVRAGSLPHLDLLAEYPRVFGLGGWHAQPMQPYGYHLAMYVTFGAAIAVAAVRAAEGTREPVLTGMLAWSGGFGLIAGSYYAAESEPGSILSLLSPWFFALALLVVVVARSLAARGWRRPTPVELCVLFGFALSLNAILRIPYPWLETTRLQQHAADMPLRPPAVERSISSMTTRSERVALLVPLGERIAHDLGLVNIAPYPFTEAMPTREMLQRAIDAVRDADVHKLFIDALTTKSEQLVMLQAEGFTQRGPGLLMDTTG